jgi:hypothetical protein
MFMHGHQKAGQNYNKQAIHKSKSYVFWDATTCSQFKVNQHFGGRACVLHVRFLLGLFFDYEAEKDMLLRNVG